MLLIARVYKAESPEEALQQYLFGPASYSYGDKTHTIFIKRYMWEHYPDQEIKVNTLPDGKYYEH